MGNLKEDNKAEYNMTVGSLKVLHGIEGAGITTIKRQIQALQNSVASVTEKTTEYWRDVAKDNVISPTEKASIKREYNNLDQTYTSIITAATAKEYLDKTEIKNLQAAYTALKTYLFTTIKLFDDMYTSTELSDVNTFNYKFSDYYSKEYIAQSLLSQGNNGGYQVFMFASGTLTTYPTDEDSWYDAPPTIPSGSYLWLRTAFRAADGTLGTWVYTRIQGDKGETGDKGDTGERGPEVKALYSQDGESDWHETFDSLNDRYMKLSYDEGVTYTAAMKIVGEDGQGSYTGPVTSASGIPDLKDGTFFLVVSDGIEIYSVIKVNGIELEVNGKLLAVKKQFEKGYIYYANNGSWLKVSEKDNYRYVLAVNDLIKYDIEISPELQAKLEKIAEDAASAAATEAAAAAVKPIQEQIDALHTPEYLGNAAADPSNPGEGDWYTYTGEYQAEPERKTAYVYRYEKDTAGTYSWVELSATQTSNYSYYMQALPDVLDAKQDELTTEYFATIFAKAIIGNTAFLKKLCSQIIELQEGDDGETGILKSSNYGTTKLVSLIKFQYSTDKETWVDTMDEGSYYAYVRIINISDGSTIGEDYLDVVNYGWSYAFTNEKSEPTSWTSFNHEYSPVEITGKYLYTRLVYRTTINIRGPYDAAKIKVLGFQIDTEGNQDFNSNTHIGGTATIDGDTTIGGKVDISGDCTITDGIVTAKAISFYNIQPGDIILRKYESINSGEYSECYTQICGTGKVRVKIKLLKAEMSFKYTTTIIETANFSQSIIFEKLDQVISVDVPIIEGQSIKISLPYEKGGVINLTSTVDIEICTNNNNGILAYLGTTGLTKTETSPIR